MIHSDFRQHFYQSLTRHYLQGELQALYHWCMEEIHGWSRAEVYLHNDEELDGQEEAQWRQVIHRLQQHEPLQYIFNKAHFMDMELYVDPSVLIPRPETEELVELLLSIHNEPRLRVLDIGTGSGCIPVALKRQRPYWELSACDVSGEALKTAVKNASMHGVEVDFFPCDVSRQRLAERLPGADIVVSNPPYINAKRKGTLAASVEHYEPPTALFAPGGDPFFFFREITRQAVEFGAREVFFETEAVDMEELTREVKVHWTGTVETRRDLQGKERFLVLGEG